MACKFVIQDVAGENELQFYVFVGGHQSEVALASNVLMKTLWKCANLCETDPIGQYPLNIHEI